MSIEKNIPLPLPKIYGMEIDFEKMNIGDSILIPCEKEKTAYVRSRLSIVLKDIDVKITTRVEKDGLRFWRLR